MIIGSLNKRLVDLFYIVAKNSQFSFFGDPFRLNNSKVGSWREGTETWIHSWQLKRIGFPFILCESFSIQQPLRSLWSVRKWPRSTKPILRRRSSWDGVQLYVQSISHTDCASTSYCCSCTGRYKLDLNPTVRVYVCVDLNEWDDDTRSSTTWYTPIKLIKSKNLTPR